LSQRYGKDLAQEFPGVDAFLGVPTLNREKMPAQVQLTPTHFAYVKICESCFNTCSFCAIPQIKGKFISRDLESIVKEVKELDAKGVKEINIIGQDITAYGMDIYRQRSLAGLLKELVGVIRNIEWIRLLYAFPSHVTDELIAVIAQEPKICKYIDMPLQHISDHILLEQNRNITAKETVELVQKIRKAIPQVFLRTTFIAGLPGETDEDFKQLRTFIKDLRFERAGVFVYSKEEGTPAAAMKGQVPEKTKKSRLDALMKDQQAISTDIQRSFVGRTLKVLIEEEKKDAPGTYIGRSEYDAPDVDGVVFVRSKTPLKIGDFVRVKITDAYEYDLAGTVQ
jgi:ribosomal protein S12 methylthiotransferase